MPWGGSSRSRAGAGICVLVGFLLLVGPEPAYSQIELGPFRVLPLLETSLEYNDNIVLAPRDETDDVIWVISPGIALELPARRWAARLGYRADILEFFREDQLDADHHTLQGDAQVNFPWGLNLYVSDEFKRTTDFFGFPVPELTRRVERNENLLQTGAEYQVRDRISLAFDYHFFLVDYRDEPIFDELDRQDHLFAFTLFYRFLPKTSVLGEYNRQLIRYDIDRIARDRDSDSDKFKVGLRGDFTAKTTGIIKVGAEFKDFDNPDRRDWDGLIVEAEAIYRYREPSQLRLFAARANIESTFEDNNFFVATYGGAELRHHLRPRLLVRLDGLVGVNDYPEKSTVGDVTKERFDWFFDLGVGLRYHIRRWLAVEASYAYLVRNSNFDDFDYTNNRVRATVSLTF